MEIVTSNPLGMLFGILLVSSISFILFQCVVTKKNLFEIFKSENYRLVGNGFNYKIQQKFMIFFWLDYYGFSVQRTNGKIDITITNEQMGLEILESLKQQALENKAENQWTTIAQ